MGEDVGVNCRCVHLFWGESGGVCAYACARVCFPVFMHVCVCVCVSVPRMVRIKCILCTFASFFVCVCVFTHLASYQEAHIALCCLTMVTSGSLPLIGVSHPVLLMLTPAHPCALLPRLTSSWQRKRRGRLPERP